MTKYGKAIVSSYSSNFPYCSVYHYKPEPLGYVNLPFVPLVYQELKLMLMATIYHQRSL
jgi:hypothetical protein